jgi:hypothetical protein
MGSTSKWMFSFHDTGVYVMYTPNNIFFVLRVINNILENKKNESEKNNGNKIQNFI